MPQPVSINRRRFATLAGATALNLPDAGPRPDPLEAEEADHDLQPLRSGRRHRRAHAPARRGRGQDPGAAGHHRHQAGRRRPARTGHAAEREARRLHAGRDEHQHAALSALPADQLESADRLHLHHRPLGLHDGHRRALRFSLEDLSGHDRCRQEGPRQVQFRHLGRRRRGPSS